MLKKLFARQKGPMIHHIEMCISNSAYGDPDVFDRLLERDDLSLEEVGCNSYCEICECQPFALVNGDLVAAESEKELFEKVIIHLESVPIY